MHSTQWMWNGSILNENLYYIFQQWIHQYNTKYLKVLLFDLMMFSACKLFIILLQQWNCTHTHAACIQNHLKAIFLLWFFCLFSGFFLCFASFAEILVNFSWSFPYKLLSHLCAIPSALCRIVLYWLESALAHYRECNRGVEREKGIEEKGRWPEGKWGT